MGVDQHVHAVLEETLGNQQILLVGFTSPWRVAEGKDEMLLKYYWALVRGDVPTRAK
jgi:hypothetical protein